jgi:hypothetical protein
MSTNQRGFKQGLRRKDPAAKRRVAAEKIRKEKRERGIMWKRMKASAPSDAEPSGAGAGVSDATDASPAVVTPAAARGLVEGLTSGHVGTRTGSLRSLRRLLSPAGEAGAALEETIQVVLEAGAAPLLIQFVASQTPGPAADEHKLEACWCLSNIATGTHEQTATVMGAAPYLIGFVQGGNAVLKEQALWALGNLAADSQECRDVLFASGALPAIIATLDGNAASSASLSEPEVREG